MNLHWAKDERIQSTGAGLGSFLKMVIPPNLVYRRFYCYTEVIPVSGSPNHVTKLDFIIRRAGNPIVLPADLANNATGSSTWSVFGNVPSGNNGILFYEAGGPNNGIYLTPLVMKVEADAIELVIRSFDQTLLAGFRAAFGVMSSDEPLP